MAIYVLSNLYDRAKLEARVKDLLAAKDGVVELKKKHPQRTRSQNSYAHVCFAYFAAETGLTAEDVKQEIFKKICNPETFCHKVTIKKNGKSVVVDSIRSSASLDTEEFTRCLERFRNWSASEAGIYIPAPSEHEALLHAEQVIASYAEYL